MITIKLSADNLRLLRAVKTETELRGAVDLVLERVAQAEQLRVFGREPTPAEKRSHGKYNWKVAVEVMGRVLGKDLKYPPFPDPIWYQRVGRGMKMYDLNEEKLVALAEYARDNLNPPHSLDFLVNQHERILAGDYNRGVRRGASSDATYLVNNWRKNNTLPEE